MSFDDVLLGCTCGRRRFFCGVRGRFGVRGMIHVDFLSFHLLFEAEGLWWKGLRLGLGVEAEEILFRVN